MDDSPTCADSGTDAQHVDSARQRLLDVQIAGLLAEPFKALADPTRVQILSALFGGELCVGELAATLDMSISAVSHQLGLLRHLRIIKHRREGRHIYYTLDDEHIATLFRCGLEHVQHS